MSYYESIDAELYFKNDTSESVIDGFMTFANENLYEHAISETVVNNYINISINSYCSYASDDIENVIKEYDDIIVAAEIYVEGEECGDFWRMRKIEGEKDWRREGSYIVYEGEDIPTFNGSTEVKSHVNPDKLIEML